MLKSVELHILALHLLLKPSIISNHHVREALYCTLSELYPYGPKIDEECAPCTSFEEIIEKLVFDLDFRDNVLDKCVMIMYN